MSLIATVALASVLRGDDQAVEMLSKVILTYRNQVAASGTVNLTISDGRGSKEIKTEFAYEKPSLLFVTQSQTGPGGWTYKAACDGRLVLYDAPLARQVVGLRADPTPILDTVRRDDGYLRTVPDLFGLFRPLLPTADNPPLDIAFSRKEHLEFLRNQWGSFQTEGKDKVNGNEVTWIGGDYKPVGTYVAGHWRMAVTPQFEIAKYELRERFSNRPGDATNFVEVTYTFDVSIKLGEKVAREKYDLDMATVKKVIQDLKANGKDVTKFLGG
ncbi:MAG: hypothetical protein KF857_02050 [Fimbriimonadaceae bacterium]|nr:hypothetical protein [Fimbriimonadaceae bacterium]